jgi:hypothetical protein
MLESYSNIINSEEFKEFKKENPECFLSSVFLDGKTWQFNFSYDKKLITFYIQDSLIHTEESELYDSGQEIKELRLNDIKISLEKAEKLMEKIREKEKITDTINKKIIILQQKDYPYWNITYITSSLNVFNVKINAVSGKIIEQKFENILKFQKS